MAAEDMQLIGLCRWSYPSKAGAFDDEEMDLEAIRAKLYDPARLATRLFFLEHIVLPPLRAQSDPNFTVLMLMGDQLPNFARDKVLALIKDIPQITPVFETEGQAHQTVCSRLLMDARNPAFKAIGEFRVDDDDAVAIDFIARTRDMFQRSRAIWRSGGKLAMDFSRGFIMGFSDKDIETEQVFSRFWNIAMVIFIRPRATLSQLNFVHTKVWQTIPTVTFPRVPMYIRGLHFDNSSGIARSLGGAEPAGDVDNLSLVLLERFNIDYAALTSAWQHREF